MNVVFGYDGGGQEPPPPEDPMVEMVAVTKEIRDAVVKMAEIIPATGRK